MTKFVLTAALAVATLGSAAIDTAHAQYIVTGSSSQGYYNSYSPNYYDGGFVPAGGYYYNNYSYNNFPNYGYNGGYSPNYSGYSNYSPSLRAYDSFSRRGSYGNTYNYIRRGGR